MTGRPAARPTPLSRVWSGSKLIAEDLQGGDLSDVLELHADASAWWVLGRGSDHTDRQLRQVADELELDELALHDLLATDRRARFEELGQARLLTANAVRLDRQRAELVHQPVSVIATDRVLICAVEPFPGFQPAAALSHRQEWLSDGGVEAALQVVVGSVLGSYEDVVEWLEDATDRLADALFEERPLAKSEQIWAFRLRRVVSELRRLSEPMRAVLSDIAESRPQDQPAAGQAALARHWRLIEERYQRLASATDALRDALSSVLDTSLSLTVVRMNVIMKKLSGWAAIIAVPTLITGFVGMNVAFPLTGTQVGFWIYLLVMVLAAAGLYAVFRRRDWV